VSARAGSIARVSAPVDPPSLAKVLADARHALGLSLREVERRTGIRNAHLSQIETGTIARPEMALLWELSVAYEVDFPRLLTLAGYEAGEAAAADRGRMTVALRALGQLTPAEQAEALQFMAELRRRREQ
jgi:HTH-type transcriptional regulator, competence development regulator